MCRRRLGWCVRGRRAANGGHFFSDKVAKSLAGGEGRMKRILKVEKYISSNTVIFVPIVGGLSRCDGGEKCIS